MRHNPDALMLFAAGFGTRMGALTSDRPKPLIEVAGRPLIDHALALARDEGIDRVVANAHYLHGLIEGHLAPQGIAVSVELPRILDTGGGLKAALPLLGDGPVMTLNSDAVWTGPNPLRTLRRAWDPDRMDALLLLSAVGDATGRAPPGDFTRRDDGRLTRSGDMVYLGASVLNPSRLSAVAEKEFSLNMVWDRIAAEGRLYGAVHAGGWCDVGHPGGIVLAEQMLKAAPDV